MANPALNENFNENQIKALATLGEDFAVATETTAGVVLQGVAVADGAEPFASLTTAAEKVNELLASLRAAGLIAV